MPWKKEKYEKYGNYEIIGARLYALVLYYRKVVVYCGSSSDFEIIKLESTLIMS